MTTPNLKRILVLAAFLCLLGFVLVGCQSLGKLKRIKPPEFRASGTSGLTVNASGDAQKAGKVESSKEETSLRIPKGSTVSYVESTPNEPAKTVVTLSEDTSMQNTRLQDRIETPLGNQPPSANEIATARGILWAYWLAGGSLLLGFAAIYFQHYKAGGLFCLAAVLAVPLTRFLASDKALIVLAVILAVAGTLWVAWYMVKNAEDKPDPNIRRE